MVTDRKQQNHQSWYNSMSHWHIDDVMVDDITFFVIFLLFLNMYVVYKSSYFFDYKNFSVLYGDMTHFFWIATWLLQMFWQGFWTAVAPFNFTAISGHLAGAPALMVSTYLHMSTSLLADHWYKFVTAEAAAMLPRLPLLHRSLTSIRPRHLPPANMAHLIAAITVAVTCGQSFVQLLFVYYMFWPRRCCVGAFTKGHLVSIGGGHFANHTWCEKKKFDPVTCHILKFQNFIKCHRIKASWILPTFGKNWRHFVNELKKNTKKPLSVLLKLLFISNMMTLLE